MASIARSNLTDAVTWVHSYVADDRRKRLCIYDAPSTEAIRRSAAMNSVPVDRIERGPDPRSVLLQRT